MEIHVKDNAINSLEVGLQFYNKFLNKIDTTDISLSHFGNLKFSVMAIHNSIELFTKSILLDINEFLVFKAEVEKDDVLCELLRIQYADKKSKAHIAYHAVFSENSYKTIEYEKCILLLQKIFHNKVSKKDYDTLKELSEYRNTLTHLGYASTFEWYKILIVLNKSLELLLEFYNKNLINAEEYFTNKVIRSIELTLTKSKKNIKDIWMASREHILEEMNDKLQLYFDNNFVQINDTKEDTEYGFYERIDFTYADKDKDFKMTWEFMYSYLNDSIIIVDSKGYIVGFLSLDDEYLKYSYDERGFPEDLVEVYILVPKENLNFEEEKIYVICDKTKNERFAVEPKKFSALVNKYLSRKSI